GCAPRNARFPPGRCSTSRAAAPRIDALDALVALRPGIPATTLLFTLRAVPRFAQRAQPRATIDVFLETPILFGWSAPQLPHIISLRSSSRAHAAILRFLPS